MRLLLLCLAAGLCLVMALLGTRYWGLSIPYQRFEHDFLKGERPLISARVRTESDVRSLLNERPDLIPWLDVRQSADQQFIVLPNGPLQDLLVEKSFAPDGWKGPFVSRYTLEELRPIFSDAPLLTEVLKAFPQQRFILNIVDNNPSIDRDLVAALEPLNPDGRLLVVSDVDAIVKSVKDLKPLWLFGSSQPDLMKILTFESLGIESASPFRGDVMIAPLTINTRAAYNRGVIEEVRRRQKTVILGPLKDGAEFAQALEDAPDGYVFETPELALKLWEQMRPSP